MTAVYDHSQGAN